MWLWVEGIKCGASVQAGGFVCLYIGIVWLWVEGIKCGVSVQPVALYFVYRHCVVLGRGN